MLLAGHWRLPQTLLKGGDLTTRPLFRASKASAFSLDLPKFIEFEKQIQLIVEPEIIEEREETHICT